MAVTPNHRAVSHMFMPGDTVVGALKKYNRYQLTVEETEQMKRAFKEINPDVILRPGMRVLIPIHPRLYAEVFGAEDLRQPTTISTINPA